MTFNGVGSTSAPPQFEVNGLTKPPTDNNLLWDAEFILGGNGAGSNAVLQEINATATLEYLDHSSQYVSVPAAYDYGADTGETSYGVAASYRGTTENLTTGPSMLYGLWNTKNGAWGDASSSTTWNLSITGLPNYAFAFLENTTRFDDGLPSLSYWPAAANGALTTNVPALPGSETYTLVVYANGYETDEIPISGSMSASETMTAEPTVFDTPVYLRSTAQATSFGASGVPGVQANAHNLWINDTEATLAAPFLLTNDFRFPTFLLFAELDLTISVSLDRFTQNPTSFNYTSSLDSTPTFLPGWSQGYYFNFGTGHFSVSNTSVFGNSTEYYASGEEDLPLPAIEFWTTPHANASNILTAQDIFGVAVYFSSGTGLFNISASGGADAVAIVGSQSLRAVDIAATGTDIEGEESVAVNVDAVQLSTFDGISASHGGQALDVANETRNQFENVRVVDSVAGVIDDSLRTSLSGITLNETDGLTLSDCQICTAKNIAVIDGDGIAADGDTYLNVTDLSATDGSFGLLADVSSHLNFSGVLASGGSFGAAVESSATVRGVNFNATGESIAFGADVTLGLNLAYLNASSGSLGLLSVGNDWLNLTHFNATESAPGADYFEFEGSFEPTAAVYGEGDRNVTLLDGTAVEYNYGVVSNDSNYLTVSHLAEVGGVYGIALTDTANTTIFDVLLYGNEIGIWTSGTFNLKVDVGTLEASTSYGLWVNDGLDAIVSDSNFVGNNGASTNGTYDSSHLQAGAAGTSSIEFNFDDEENYWSDWNASVGPYVIAAGISDPAPRSAFFTNWLAFVETGLPSGTVWGITLDGTAYDAGLPIVILPSYTVGDPELAYSVNSPALYAATPSSGSVDYTGTNTTVPISFSPTAYEVIFNETGLASGATWKATLNGATISSTDTTISFVETAGTYDWSVSAAGYTAAPSSGSVVVPGSGTTIDVTFTAIPSYAVTFTESGLAAGTNWSVVLNGTLAYSTTSSIVFEMPNGDYDYSVSSVAGYTISPPSAGSVDVNGAPQSKDVTFSPVTATYAITFSETGLASGTVWSVTIGATTQYSDNASVVISEPAGSYDYTVGPVANYSASPSSGSVDVTDAAQTVPVAFTAVTAPTYTLTFTETGLPSGTNWSVTVNGATHAETTATITFSEAAGSYTFSVTSAAANYVASPAGGTVSVTSSGASVSIAFSLSSTPTTTNKTSTLFGLTAVEWAIIGVVAGVIIGGLLAALFLGRRGRSGSADDAGSGSTTPPSDIETTSTGPSEYTEDQ